MKADSRLDVSQTALHYSLVRGEAGGPQAHWPGPLGVEEMAALAGTA